MVIYRKFKYQVNDGFGMPEKGWKTVGIREDLFKEIERAAEAENRSVSNWVENVMKKTIEKGKKQ